MRHRISCYINDDLKYEVVFACVLFCAFIWNWVGSFYMYKRGIERWKKIERAEGWMYCKNHESLSCIWVYVFFFFVYNVCFMPRLICCSLELNIILESVLKWAVVLRQSHTHTHTQTNERTHALTHTCIRTMDKTAKSWVNCVRGYFLDE